MEQQKRYGHFDDQHREYVITDPQTPWPWINYLGNEDFFSLISNTAGGYSFYKDAKFRRITRYRYNNVPMDNGGRYFYIRESIPQPLKKEGSQVTGQASESWGRLGIRAGSLVRHLLISMSAVMVWAIRASRVARMGWKPLCSSLSR